MTIAYRLLVVRQKRRSWVVLVLIKKHDCPIAIMVTDTTAVSRQLCQ